MATALKLADDTATDLVAAVTANPQLVLLDRKQFDTFYARMKAETDTLAADVTTTKGRDEIRSMARRVVTTKTTIDKARLALTKQWREQVDQANAAGKVITERLDGLAVEVRAPLTAWEDAEKACVAECEAQIAWLRAAAVVTMNDTSESVIVRGREVKAVVIDEAVYQGLTEQAIEAKRFAWEQLKASYERLTREESERAELARLRAAEAERIAREEAARVERERIAAEEQAERDRVAAAEQAERDRIAAREAEAARIAEATAQAEKRARQEADRAREEEQRREQEEHERQLAAERQARERVEREAAEERERIAAVERARVAEEERLAAEHAARDADKALQRRLKTEAKQALMACGATEDIAQKIVLAVRAGEIPHVSWLKPGARIVEG